MRNFLTRVRLYIKQWACEHEVQNFVRHNEGYKIGCSDSTVWKCTSCEKEILTEGLERIIGDEGTMFRIWDSRFQDYQIKGHYILDASK